MAGLQLVVGLGNPGTAYERTRHNVGADWVVQVASDLGLTLSNNPKFYGLHAHWRHADGDLHFLVPTTFMNRSGQSVAAILNFYRIAFEQMLVAHDELDLPAGVARLKLGGGHGGHNGLRDIVAQCGHEAGFYRLRLGIGHPGHKSQVSDFVLSKPAPQELKDMRDAMISAHAVFPRMRRGEWTEAMQQLHTRV